MRTHAQIALHLQDLLEGPQAQADPLEGFVLAYAQRSRRRRVSDEEFERALLGYAKARSIAYGRELSVPMERLRALGELFRGARHEATRTAA